MSIGDRVQVKPCSEGGARGVVMGRVVYIHPQHRYFTVEFDAGGGKLRESFPFDHRRG